MDYGPLNMHLRNFVSAHNALAVQPARSVQKRAAVTELEATAAGARKPKPRHAFWRRANLELKIWQKSDSELYARQSPCNNEYHTGVHHQLDTSARQKLTNLRVAL